MSRLRWRLRYLRGALEDARLFLAGRGDRELPPNRLRFVGAGDFRAVGDEMVNLLTTIGGLRAEDRVLDVGCGVGRVALPLTRLLTSTYDGFDVVKSAVRWCQRNITPRHPNFRFHHANLYNSFYNRRGVPASQYRFPFADGAFDFAFATSVFTHLSPDSTRNYLDETHRVLRSGGRLLATFFVLGAGHVPGFDFAHRAGGYALLDPKNPEAAIAFDAETLQRLAPESKWRVMRFERGAWTGRIDAPTFQDTAVLEKSA
jgi:SAM-dependent methyltransferase